MTPLEQIDGWDVTATAAAVVSVDGVLADRGPIDRPFALASVSKVLAALAAHIAIEEGTVGLDDDTTPSGGPPGGTVRHLLAHAGGLAPDGDRTPLGAPGRKRIYSNVGFEVLGDHVAAGTGMAMDDYVRAALVEPLGLSSTAIEGSPAHGYSSSVEDLAAVLAALHHGRLLAPSSVEALTTPAFPDLAGVLPGFGAQDPNPWGLGVEVRGDKDPHWTSPDNSPQTWGHFGRAGTFVWWDPAVDVGLIVLTDREFGPWAIEAWPALASAVLAHHT